VTLPRLEAWVSFEIALVRALYMPQAIEIEIVKSVKRHEKLVALSILLPTVTLAVVKATDNLSPC
jgi:hypothetical protein